MPLIRCKVRLCSITCTMKEIPTQIVKKCQWYDPVDGTPIRGGCRRGADCEFVHPSHLRWNDAPPPRNSFNSFNGPKRTSSNTLELGRRTSGLTSWVFPEILALPMTGAGITMRLLPTVSTSLNPVEVEDEVSCISRSYKIRRSLCLLIPCVSIVR